MRHKWLARLACIAALAAGLAALVPQAEAGRRKPRKPARSAPAGEARTEKLWGIPWHATVDAALAAAKRPSAAEQRPVFCLRVLGDVDGFM